MEPIFVIGSYRSGTSVLTWALGQHANIFPLEETNWIYRLGLYLDCLYQFGSSNGEFSNLSSMGITRTRFYKSFGRHVDSLLLENREGYLGRSLKVELKKKDLLDVVDMRTLKHMKDFVQYTREDDLYLAVRSKQDLKNRWVDGTPENSHFAYCLNLMFPKAKFIFLIRNPIKVAHSLMNFATVTGRKDSYDEESAYDQWYRLTESCYYALKAYGTNKVLLIHQEDLVSQKEMTIKKCLHFLSEEYDDNCLKPFKVVINSSQYDRSQVDFSIKNGLKSTKKHVRKACLFYNHILNDTFDSERGNLYYYRVLRNRYLREAKFFY